jgi:XTP/dITP diphosphohydrolase
LEVDALNGAPGVHSARFANPTEAKNAPDRANIEKLLKLLQGVPIQRRTARFRCVIALTPVLRVSEKHRSPVCNADEFELATQIAEGVCEGRIGFEPKGQGGFGYDPLFVPEGFSETFAELSEEVKNGLSHRGRALAALKGKH